MNIDRKNMIEKVLYLIKEDYVFHKSTGMLEIATFCDLDNETYKRIDDLLKATRQDFSKILTIMNCIENTYTMYRENRFIKSYYVMNNPALEEIACHIEYLFTKYRVILEYMEEILNICIPPIMAENEQKEYKMIKKGRGGKAKAERFDFLLNYIAMNDEEKQKILNTNWFQDFRENRNFLIHRGAGCLVYGNQTEILFSVMRVDEMERDEEIKLDEYFLTDNMLIRYHRFWGIMLSELILFCESIFEFLLSKASISEDKKNFLDITNYSKRMFKTEENLDKQTVLENVLNLILMEENIK